MAGQALENKWDESKASGLDQPGLLLYRSNLLGSDKRITNYGGGNTSAKVMMTDPLSGDQVEVLLGSRGSGGDVGSMKLDGFATLYMDKLHQIKKLYRGLAHEDEMVGYPAALHLQSECARSQHRHTAARLSSLQAC